MRPISGRLRAASMKRCVCSARYCGAPPLRSCSCIVKPAPVPRPGIAGGPNASTCPSGISCANAWFSASTTPVACASALCRSSHGLSCTKKKPMFEEYADGEQRVAADRVEALDRLVLLQDRLGLPHHRVGPLERRRVGQLRVDHDVALVLLRHEAAGDLPDQHDDHVHQHADEREAPEHLPDQDRREADVGVGAARRTPC